MSTNPSPRYLILLSALAMALGACQPNDEAPPLSQAREAPRGCSTRIVQTENGPLCGTKKTTTTGQIAQQYLGIPYAKPPVGPLRWQPPVPPESWSPDVFAATDWGLICPQNVPPTEGSPLVKHSEDCLFVNVWSPESAGPASKLPVMVFIHGGAFIVGSSSDVVQASGKSFRIYDGAYTAANRDVILVTLNYRLGALGYLVVEDDEDSIAGNFGFLDQRLALEWVRNNIAQFGGDPTEVTLYGESAGAMSVGLHAVSSPASAGLFKDVMMQSNPLALPYKTKADAGTIGGFFKQVVSGLGASSLTDASVEDILAAQECWSILIPAILSGFQGVLLWTPVIDGNVINSQPGSGILQQSSLLGTNLNEGLLFVEPATGGHVSLIAYNIALDVLFKDKAEKVRTRFPGSEDENNLDLLTNLITDYVFTCPNLYLASRSEEVVYPYQFTHVSSFDIWPEGSGCADQVCHGDELPFVFHSAPDLFTPEESQLSETMVAYWSNFASSENPNAPASVPVDWPAFDEYLFLNTDIATGPAPAADCDFWDEVGYDLGFPTEQWLLELANLIEELTKSCQQKRLSGA